MTVMPTARFTSPFPPLKLGDDEREQLHETATTLVEEAQALYEQFLRDDDRTIDDRRWQLTKSREDVRVYHDRRPGAGTGNKEMHLLLTVGTVVGTLHDAMYGELNRTTNAMRVKTEYVEDTLIDSAVLETILEPTVDDPFQSLTVRWLVKGIPLHVRMIYKHRDNVYLEATGMRQLANGESIGFHLMHSIAFSRAPRLPMYDRTNMSVCSIWRQQTPQLVEVYRTAYVEIQESVMMPMILKASSDALVSVWKIIDCAQRKKLAHIVGRKARFSAMQDAVNQDAKTLRDGCTVCGSETHSLRRGAKSVCAICAKAVCKKCRVKRELAFFTPDGHLLQDAIRFCVSCLTATHHMDAASIAQAEVPTRCAVMTASHHHHHYHSRDHLNSSAFGATTSSCASSCVSDRGLH